MDCPNCGHRNIPGADLCADCGTDLAGLDLPEADRGICGQLMTDTVSRISLTPPLTVPPDATAAEAITLMRREHHGCVLVQDGGRLTGIFTERDVLTRLVRAGRASGDVRMEEVMTPDPVTLEPNDPPAFAVHLVVARGLRHLPIVEDGELLGFISVRNILRYIDQDVIRPAAGEPRKGE